MEEYNGRRWALVGALFVTMFLIWGPINASGVFFLSVIGHFKWSRAFFSVLVGAAPLAAGVASPAAGWLMDRIGVRRVMLSGAAMVAASYIALSRATSAVEFLLVFIVLGVGVTASTIIPAALLLTNWFPENRGRALGIVFAGIPLGGTGVTIFANYIVQHQGFRAGYLSMGLAIAIVVIPLLAIFVHTHPGASGTASESTDSSLLPGLEVREALRTRSFWMIAIAEILFSAANVGIRIHLIPYLTGLGYTPTLAAGVFAATFILSAIGNFAIGPFADRFGGRAILTAVFATCAAGIAILLGAGHFAAVAAFVLVFGLVRDTVPVLMPLVIGDSLGVRRLGALLGLAAFSNTIGFAAGPAIAGRIFDVTGSYSGALILFIGMALTASIAIRTTSPLGEESIGLAVEPTASA